MTDQTELRAELKGCPFCGEPPISYDETGYGTFYVGCGNPKCAVSCGITCRAQMRARAIADWNRRAPDDEVERLRAELAEWNDPDSKRRQELSDEIIFNLGEGDRSEIELREGQVSALEAANSKLRAERDGLVEALDGADVYAENERLRERLPSFAPDEPRCMINGQRWCPEAELEAALDAQAEREERAVANYNLKCRELDVARENDDRHTRQRDELAAALEEVKKGVGPYSRDQLTHANNTIVAMKAVADAALKKAGRV